MSYYTSWDVCMKKTTNAISTYEDAIKTFLMWEDAYHGTGMTEEELKSRAEEDYEWYAGTLEESDPSASITMEGNHYDSDLAEEVLATISAQFPDLKFCICGYGEENGDLWKCYAYKGVVETIVAEMVFPEIQNEELCW